VCSRQTINYEVFECWNGEPNQRGSVSGGVPTSISTPECLYSAVTVLPSIISIQNCINRWVGHPSTALRLNMIRWITYPLASDIRCKSGRSCTGTARGVGRGSASSSKSIRCRVEVFVVNRLSKSPIPVKAIHNRSGVTASVSPSKTYASRLRPWLE